MASDKTEGKKFHWEDTVVFAVYFSRRQVANILPSKMGKIRKSAKDEII